MDGLGGGLGGTFFREVVVGTAGGGEELVEKTELIVVSKVLLLLLLLLLNEESKVESERRGMLSPLRAGEGEAWEAEEEGEEARKGEWVRAVEALERVGECVARGARGGRDVPAGALAGGMLVWRSLRAGGSGAAVVSCRASSRRLGVDRGRVADW